jgi:chemotaxis protein histidine kinase CheA/ActR/RegA family two-component response regulator
MNTDPEIYAEGLSNFVNEAQDLLQHIEQDLWQLHEEKSNATVHSLMRSTHTLKGASASVDLENVREIAHALEDIFKSLYNPDIKIDAELEKYLFQAYETLQSLVTEELVKHQQNDDAEDDETASPTMQQARAIIEKIKNYLGDAYNPDAEIPSSEELGFDMVQSIFEIGVKQRLESLQAALKSSDSEEVANTLRSIAEVFVGLSESLKLPGFGDIAKTVLTAVEFNPDLAVKIAEVALEDFWEAVQAVLNGDRTRGGEPSEKLKNLAHTPSSSTSASQTSQASSQPPSQLPESVNHFSEGEETPSVREQTPPTETETAEETFSGVELDDVFGSFDPGAIDTASDFDGDQQEQGDTGDTESSDVGSGGVNADFGSLEIEEMVEIPSPPPPSEEPQAEAEDTTEETDVAPQLTQPTSLELEQDSAPLSQWEEISPRAQAPTAGAAAKEEKGTQQHRETTTVKVNLEQLERLNFQAGELLIEHNKQYSGTEDLQTSVKKLQEQLSQHQKILSSLQSLAWSMNAKQNHDRASVSASQRSRSGKTMPSVGSNQISWDALEMDNYSQMQTLLQSAYEEMVQMREVADSIDLYSKQSSSALQKQQRLLTKVRDDLTLARMQPIGEVLERFPRTVQQLCITHEKDVALQIRGEDVLVDKAIAQKLYDPLLHLVRNAFSHGIEPADQRQGKGKSTQGTIEIRAYTQGNRTTIEIRDDGKGIDYEAIRQRAIAQGVVSSNRASQLRRHQLLEFIFETGFSTAANVDNVSGRGVGLDVVRSQLNAIGASINVSSQPDKGTCFRLQLPLTLSIAKLLVCASQGVHYAIPSETIEQILFPDSKEITFVGQQRVLSLNREGTEHSVPIHRLEDLIRHTSSIPTQHSTPTNGNGAARKSNLDAALSTTSEGDRGSLILLLDTGSGLVGLEVESVLGEQELVIRPLSKVVRAPEYVYGCSILANSRLALAIDVLNLIQNHLTQGNPLLAALPTSQAGSGRGATAPITYQSKEANYHIANGTGYGKAEVLPQSNQRRVRSVMVVDDSVTLRQNVVTTLQKAGYRALTARDGQEALEKLRSGEAVDVILCDIEMPRMNGFEFLTQYRQDTTISDIPTIMLTSRQGDKHRHLATGLGAVGYITKPYLERDLLAAIEEQLPKSLT